MQDKSNILVSASVIICAFFLVLAVSSFRNTRRMELEFNEKKAVFLKENMDLKDRISALQDMVSQRTDITGIMEKEKKALEIQINMLKQENDDMMKARAEELKRAKVKRLTLKKRVATLEKSPIVQRIREAIAQETDENAKLLLEDAATKLELIKSGKAVNLEPIVVTKGIAALSVSGMMTPEETKAVILSLDRQNNLAVINLGRKDNVKEGDTCKILKDGEEIATAEVMSVRYRIAAAFINEVNFKYTLDDIKEGAAVIMTQKK